MDIFSENEGMQKGFYETKYMSFLNKKKKINYQKKYKEIWEKSAITSKKNLIVSLYIIKNI